MYSRIFLIDIDSCLGIVYTFSNVFLVVIVGLIQAESSNLLFFEVKNKAAPTTQFSVWALRKSKLPMRMSFRNTKNKVYGELLFSYSERKDAKFFDPNAFTGQ